MSRGVEGELGPPAKFVLPVSNKVHAGEHLLLLLARRTREAAAPGFNFLTALNSDINRFFTDPQPSPGWGLSAGNTPEVLVIGRLSEASIPELFVGVMEQTPVGVDYLASSSSTLTRRKVLTAFGKIVTADVSGSILTQSLELDHLVSADPSKPSDWETLKKYLNPNAKKASPSPEIFTWDSAFNPAKDPFPGVAGIDQIQILTDAQRLDMAYIFLYSGLEVLAGESSKFVKLSAERLLKRCKEGMIDLQLTDQPYDLLQRMGKTESEARLMLPEKHGLGYIPAEGTNAGSIVVPYQWLDVALNREIVGLTHLVRLASIARDNYFGKASGTVMSVNRELGEYGELSQATIAYLRADRLASEFFREADGYDNRVYSKPAKRDNYCRSVENNVYSVGYYEDPSEPKRGSSVAA